MRAVKVAAAAVLFAILGAVISPGAAWAPTVHWQPGSQHGVQHQGCTLQFIGGNAYASAYAKITYEPWYGPFQDDTCTDYTYVRVVGRDFATKQIVYGPLCGYGNADPGFAGCGFSEGYEWVQTYIPYATVVSAQAFLCDDNDCTMWNIWLV